MTAKKIMGIITLVIVGCIGLFSFFLYATIKTKSTNLDKYDPFKEWVGNTVTLDKETVVFEEKIKMNPNSKYPYVLLDSLHPRWEYIREQKEIGDVTEIKIFPAGTNLTLEKAIQYTNGVSGASYPTIFGTITETDGDNAYKVGYQWGEQDIAKSHYKIEKCWHFHQAPWQDEPDTAHYALPIAAWW